LYSEYWRSCGVLICLVAFLKVIGSGLECLSSRSDSLIPIFTGCHDLLARPSTVVVLPPSFILVLFVSSVFCQLGQPKHKVSYDVRLEFASEYDLEFLLYLCDLCPYLV
jgi:hypothetical protein